jgi:L-cysteine S-thiosulfotransferase
MTADPIPRPPDTKQRSPWKLWTIIAGTTTALAAAVAVAVIGAHKAFPGKPSPVDAAIAASWATSPAHARLWARQDPTQRDCTLYGNAPPDREAVAIMEREWRAIVYPADGEIFGDWQKGAALARDLGIPDLIPGSQSTVSGQCAACHRLEPANPTVAGSIQLKSGPDLAGYGRKRAFAPAEPKLLYEQIYSSNAVIACSNMPRFGSHKVLSPEQIRDIVAYLLSPHSPVNAEPETTASVVGRSTSTRDRR